MKKIWLNNFFFIFNDVKFIPDFLSNRLELKFYFNKIHLQK